MKHVSKGITIVDEAFLENDTQLALKLGKAESKIDKGYRKLLQSFTKKLKNQSNTEDYISGLFVAHAIEQMGDALMGISESIISSNIGQSIDIQRFQSLHETLSSWLDKEALEELEIKPIAETRSGSGISSVQYRGTDETDDPAKQAIYKDGEKRKLKEELDGVQSWHQIYPGVAPKILTYHKNGSTGVTIN